ncbi:hypothetical protein [Eikenella halliae]|uniref:hypothetical protein n=1 Tax=Eikenella halliae TaxID=1795832 RepID=UPI000A82D003|nr:hypothetical protein [Eikenella halliae]
MWQSAGVVIHSINRLPESVSFNGVKTSEVSSCGAKTPLQRSSNRFRHFARINQGYLKNHNPVSGSLYCIHSAALSPYADRVGGQKRRTVKLSNSAAF